MARRRTSGGRSVGARQGASAARRRAAYFPAATSIPRGDQSRGMIGNLTHIGQLSSAQGRRVTAMRNASRHGPKPIPVLNEVIRYLAHGNPSKISGYTRKPVRGGHARRPNSPRVGYESNWLKQYRAYNARALTRKRFGSDYL